MKSFKKEPKKILIIKFCCLGDIVYLTPTVQALRLAYPHASISILVSSWTADLISCIPTIDKVMVSDAPYESTRWKKIVSAYKLVRMIRSYRPDMVFAAHRNSLIGLLSLLSGAKNRLGFEETLFLTHTSPFKASEHEVDRYLSIITSYGINTQEKKTYLRAPEKDCKNLDRVILENGIPYKSPFIVIFPGGGENPGTRMIIKRWSPDRFRDLISKINQHCSIPIVLIGSDRDQKLCNEIALNLRGVVNLAGMLSLRETVALGNRCVCFIGSDSGPTHMIAATGAPTIFLFGPSDPRLVAPRGTQHKVIWKQPHCAPCYTPDTVQNKQNFQGRTFICHTGTLECMQYINVEEVWDAVKNILISSKVETSFS